MSGPQKTLVFGVTGQHGGTGSVVVERLLGEGRSVRALVRREDGRAQALRERGAEVVVGDLHDRRTLLPALDGAGSVYFAYPVDDGIVDAAANLASAIQEQGGSQRVVVMSMAAADKNSPSCLGRAQAVAEEALRWTGVDLTVLRIAGFFHENVLAFHSAEIRETGMFANSYGGGAAPWISGDDAAEVAAAALLNPDLYAGQAIVYPPGSELLTHREIAVILGRIIGREVRYEQITQQEWQRRLEALSARHDVVNRAMAQHIATLGGRFAQPDQAPRVAPNAAALAEIIGREPISFAEFAMRRRGQFEALVSA